MARLAIRVVPDPALRGLARPVAAFDADLAALARDLLETMYAAPGRGLAAPQVGVGLRLFVMDPTWKEGTRAPLVLVNPELAWASEELASREEGCLSIPGRVAVVTRPERVRLRWRGLDGAPHEGGFEGFAATCAQHEVDHLDGVLCSDRAAAFAVV